MSIATINYAKSLKEALKSADEVEAEKVLKSFLKVVKKNGDFKKIDEILTTFESLLEKENGVVEVRVTVPEEDEVLVRDLKEKLEAKTKKEIKIKGVVNPDLIGGIKLEIEGKVWDNTIKGRLESLKSKLNNI